MTPLESALSLASRGFFVFPIRRNGKKPLHKGWQEEATRDPDAIRKLWRKPFNIGIFTSKFGENRALCVVDVDQKKGKNGGKTLLGLELQGFAFPRTLEHRTPTGGRHVIYSCDRPLRQGADVLGTGLDIRSAGGYIVAPGSEIDGAAYAQIEGYGGIVDAPDWLAGRLGADRKPGVLDRAPLPGVDPGRASARGIEYLRCTAPLAVEGEAGDTTTYRVAARLKDLGCDSLTAFELMADHWNQRCTPPWDERDLAEKIDHAYRYGREPQGVSAPEAIFEPVEPTDDEEEAPSPLEALNQEYAFVKRGAYILQETTDEKGNYVTEHLSVDAMHAWFANQPLCIGDKRKAISKFWMEWKDRRQYEGVTFAPGRDPGSRWFNLWRGFTVEPAAKASHPALDAFLEHARLNVCNGDEKLFHWLMGYFAHMVQRPSEKPLVALVFKGRKGTGKNALVERVGALLGRHFLVADDDRYLLSNFNSHLEHNLFFALDEATWAGDKKAEGRLKGLITGAKHNIERKGQEPYQVDNLTRVAILGNEDWMVPASHDERRFAVFAVGEGRMQDRKFFENMRLGMEQGGYAHLLRYLLDFDLSGVDVNDAPRTQALLEQKMESLDPLQKWWFDCLCTGKIVGGDWGGEWPKSIPTNRLREAYLKWCKAQNISGWRHTEGGFGRAIRKLAPSLKRQKARPEDKNDTTYAFFTTSLERLRLDWADFIGGNLQWD